MKAIVLTRGKIATVDDEDFDRANQFNWYAMKRGGIYYGVRNLPRAGGKQLKERLHNFILGGKGIDHRDGDGLNNRKENLRRVTQQQNLRARCRKKAGVSSKFRGVSRYLAGEKWAAGIQLDGRWTHLGRFTDETDAARAYDKAAREHFGEFASPNFP